MQPWTDRVIHTDFRVRVFLDTNLLIYLVDKRHPSLNDFIDLLNEPFNPFVELVSSSYVIFEFVGVRKREHYQRIVIRNLSKTSRGIDTLIDSFQNFRDKDKYYLPREDFDDVKFAKVIPAIRSVVQSEIETILRAFNINYEYGTFHSDQLEPAFEICLTSKLSNYDSLVLVSSVLPRNETGPHNVVFFTADSNLVTFCNPDDINAVLSKHSVLPPAVEYIANLQIAKGPPTNLKLDNDKLELQDKIKHMLLDRIKNQLSNNYLGTTIEAKNPKGTIPPEVIFIKLVENFPLIEKLALLETAEPKKKLYVTVISRELDFVYTPQKDIGTFWLNKKPLALDDKLPPDSKDIIVSFEAKDIDEEGNEKPIDKLILDAIGTSNNLVFIHPDSFL